MRFITIPKRFQSGGAARLIFMLLALAALGMLSFNFYTSVDATVGQIEQTRTVVATQYRPQTLTAEVTAAAQATTDAIAQRTLQAGQNATQTALAPTPIPTETPRPGEQSVAAVDGMVRVYIPSGSFSMGRKDKGSSSPVHPVKLDDFWMSLTQVTNAQYARCVTAGWCHLPIREEINPHYYDPEYADHPAVYIVWQYAQDYCAWSGGRLPTEAEWEWAASGGLGYSYAWGSGVSTSENYANVDNEHGGTTPVGTHPEGASPFGVLDMGGNVREWVADWFDENYYDVSPEFNPTGPEQAEKKVLRGASWHDDFHMARISNRLAHEPNSAGDNRGFRCVYP